MEVKMIETIKMSSKGQVVIPQDIREEIHAKEGTIFAVLGGKDTIILKRIGLPSKEELINEFKRIAKEGSKRSRELGIRESDVSNIIHKIRRLKRNR